jgi:transcriptional regulator of nitric oxide reductase
VRNASHAHPDKQIDPRMTRSIAKRAAGTLTAAWPDVLATPLTASSEKRAGACTAPVRTSRVSLSRHADEADYAKLLSIVGHVRFLHLRVGKFADQARKAGDAEKLEAFVAVLKEIGALLP